MSKTAESSRASLLLTSFILILTHRERAGTAEAQMYLPPKPAKTRDDEHNGRRDVLSERGRRGKETQRAREGYDRRNLERNEYSTKACPNNLSLVSVKDDSISSRTLIQHAPPPSTQYRISFHLFCRVASHPRRLPNALPFSSFLSRLRRTQRPWSRPARIARIPFRGKTAG